MTDTLFYGPDVRRLYVSVKAALILPLGVAVFTGAFTGLAAAALLWWWLPVWWLRLSLIVASISGVMSWIAMLRFWWQRKVDAVDADLFHLQAGQFASNQPARVELVSEQGRVLQIGKPPATRYQLLAAARIVLDGGTLSHRSLSAIMSPREIAAFQTWLVSQGYAAWRVPDTPQQGIEITSKGNAMFRACLGPLANSPTPELPEREGWESIKTHTHAHDL